MQKITSQMGYPLFSVAATRQIEQHAAATLPPQALMQRAGLAVARLALALAPHARCIWVACGPGNNGGDGFEAALHLHQWGKRVVLTWTGPAPGKTGLPPDAHAARQRALAAGVPMASDPPADFDFCIDALLGVGARLDTRGSAPRAAEPRIPQWLEVMQASGAPRLAVDIPTGLDADTGCKGTLASTLTGTPHAMNSIAGCARDVWEKRLFTLSLLTLKPGLFTASGKDCAGEVWFDDLGIQPPHAAAASTPCAWLAGDPLADGRPAPGAPRGARALHSSHKGSFGDVAVLGGESTATSHMAGAALLAARAALHAGAGRVFVALLDKLDKTCLNVDPQQPELMFRTPEALDFKQQVMVCGCGGGQAVRAVMAQVLSAATRVVLDADALNALATDTQLQTQLQARQHRPGYSTVLTPHPLEAARLLGTCAAQVQADRLAAATQLAERFQCVVVLKGSGTVVAAPGQQTVINSTGNALLATAGTGDVLAGMMGAFLAGGLGGFEAACKAVWVHGHLADDWALQNPGQALTASALAQRLQR